MGRVIGIDLGTSTTVAAVAQPVPQVIINGQGSRQTPSMVGFTPKGGRLVGELAKRQLMAEPDRTLHNLRRFLGRPFDEAWEDIRRVNYSVVEGAQGGVAIRANDRLYAPEALVGMILSAIKQSAESVLGDRVNEAVITAPIGFTNRQRRAIRDAGTLAGLNVLRIINEPTAAALAYLAEHPGPATLAIYDFGGASFDFTLIRADAQGIRPIATAGQARLGGWDVDLRIIQWLIEEFFTRHLIDVSREPMAMQRLRDAAERAKLELSSAERTEIRLPFLTADETGPKHIEKTLTRGDFEIMVEDLLQRTFKECDKAMAMAGLTEADVDEVILVGGGARIPRVQALVAERFRRPEPWQKNPEEILAIGAATQAYLFRRPAAPAKGIVTRLALGVEGPGGVFLPLIKEGTALPVARDLRLDVPAAGGEPLRVHVLQGVAPRVEDNISLGHLTLPALPPEARDVTLSLRVDATGEGSTFRAELSHGDAQDAFTLSPFEGLSRAPVKATGEPEETPVELTDADRESARLRETLATHLASLEKVRQDYGGRLSSRELSELDAALKRGRVAVLKTSERPAYFQEMTNYIFHFYTNLSAKLS